MDKFLDRFKPKKPSASNNNNNNNPFSSFFNNVTGGGTSSFSGSGYSLGGKLPGQIVPIELSEAGPLGIKVEKRPQGGTAIVSLVVPDSQAERAGLQRGDILCFAGTEGREEIQYQEFLTLAQSNQRPLCLEVRRIPINHTKKQNSATVNSATASTSADAFARKQAVIAAAEAREKAAQRWTKPVARKTASTLLAEQAAGPSPSPAAADELDDTPKSEAARQAAEAAKKKEAEYAAQLGYNPYEASKATAGQARNATVASKHGSLDSNGTSSTQNVAPLPVRPPRDPTTPAEDDPSRSSSSHSVSSPPPSPAFEHAYETMITSNAHEKAVSSMTILQKLVSNATTKGQAPGEAAAKFRRVRLANPKISQAIVETEGALDLLMSTGFELKEEEGESVLVFPADTTGPEWLPSALAMMQQFATS